MLPVIVGAAALAPTPLHAARNYAGGVPSAGGVIGPVDAYGATHATAGCVPGPNQISTCLLSGDNPAGGAVGGSVAGIGITTALVPRGDDGRGGRVPPPGGICAHGGE
jgi:hypothetical protein